MGSICEGVTKSYNCPPCECRLHDKVQIASEPSKVHVTKCRFLSQEHIAYTTTTTTYNTCIYTPKHI